MITETLHIETEGSNRKAVEEAVRVQAHDYFGSKLNLSDPGVYVHISVIKDRTFPARFMVQATVQTDK